MNWKTILVCGALALSPVACDSNSAEDGDDHHDTDGHDDHGDDDHGHDDHGEDTDDHNHEEELITTVTLTFTSDTADTVTASFRDPDGDGGMSGTTETITLAANTTYTMTIELLNELEDEDITEEIREEAEEHQFLLFGTAVAGPASMGSGLLTHAYADVESYYTDNAVGDDLPVGLSNTITTSDAGMGELDLMLRHLPPINDAPQKAPGLAEDFGAGGTPPGDTDVNVKFDVVVE